jgi:hypothetical protein
MNRVSIYASPDRRRIDYRLSCMGSLQARPWVGLRRWSAIGGVEMKAGEPVNKWFGVRMFEAKLYPSIRLSARRIVSCARPIVCISR